MKKDVAGWNPAQSTKNLSIKKKTYRIAFRCVHSVFGYIVQPINHYIKGCPVVAPPGAVGLLPTLVLYMWGKTFIYLTNMLLRAIESNVGSLST